MLTLALTLAASILLFGVHWLVHGLAGADWVSAEALFVVAVALALPGFAGRRALFVLAAAALVLGAWYRVAELVVGQALGRGLNLATDWYLARAGYGLLADNLGVPLALAGIVLALILSVLAAYALALGYARVAPEARPGAPRLILAAVLAGGGLAGAAVNEMRPVVPVAAPLVASAAVQADRITRTLAERARFRRALHEGGAGARAVALPRLREVDVILAFVESYGEVALRRPPFRRDVEPAMQRLGTAVERAGLHMVSGRLRAPVAGGQSWLAHGTVLSGLWLDNQIRYDLMLQSQAPTLIDDFRRTGHRTLALMPAITRHWPEGERLGYDHILARSELGYAGPPFNWVTMPDQFTWAVLARRLRARESVPIFAEVALISSHAPWTPILPVIEDWDTIGDGTIFRQWAGAGESPGTLWQDMGRVRRHYARALAYSLRVAAGFVERYVDERTLLVLLGDHPPAPAIVGAGTSDAVPVHVISGDPALLAPFRDRGFRPGPVPPESGEAPAMDRFRGWMTAAYGRSVHKEMANKTPNDQ